MKSNISHKDYANEKPNDVPADDPVGTMGRFNDGLKRVLNAPKPRKAPAKRLNRRSLD